MKVIKPHLPFRKRNDYISNNRPNYPGIPYEMFSFAQKIRNAVEASEVTNVSIGITREVLLNAVDPQA